MNSKVENSYLSGQNSIPTKVEKLDLNKNDYNNTYKSKNDKYRKTEYSEDFFNQFY